MHQKDDVHILKSSEVLKREKVSAVSLSMGIVKSKDKGFVLDLKLLLIYYSELLFRKVSPQGFYCETSLFHWFSWVIISWLFYYFAVYNIDMILMFVCFNKVY